MLHLLFVAWAYPFGSLNFNLFMQKIRELISVLDQRKDESIERTFKGVARHFREVFSELVQGGHGHLVMMKKKVCLKCFCFILFVFASLHTVWCSLYACCIIFVPHKICQTNCQFHVVPKNYFFWNSFIKVLIFENFSCYICIDAFDGICFIFYCIQGAWLRGLLEWLVSETKMQRIISIVLLIWAIESLKLGLCSLCCIDYRCSKFELFLLDTNSSLLYKTSSTRLTYLWICII